MDIEVTDAILIEHSTGIRVWQVVYTLNGNAYSHVFPHDTFHWRIAEYDLDPTDVDTLLDVILYEPHLEHIPDDPKSLHNAATITEARAHHLSRIKVMKRSGRLTERKREKTSPRPLIDPAKTTGKVIADCDTHPDPPLTMIKHHVVIDPATVTAMRDIVTHHRTQQQSTRD